MNKEELFKSIHNINDLNKAIETSTNETNYLLQKLNDLETARNSGQIDTKEEYEKEKADIESFLLREQEKLAVLSTTLETYNNIMEIYNKLRNIRDENEFKTQLEELTKLRETLPQNMQSELERTHILNEKGNRIIEINVSSIEEARLLLETSIKEEEHLHKEMQALEEATRTDNLHPNNYYIKEKETIASYLEREQEKQAIYKEIIDSYNKVIDIYKKLPTIEDKEEYSKLMEEANKLKDTLPLELRTSIELKNAFSNEQVRETNQSEQELVDAVEQELDRQKEEEEKTKEEAQEIENKVKEKIENDKELINKYKEEFNEEINEFQENDLENNNEELMKKEENHLNNLDSINNKYKETLNEINKATDLNNNFEVNNIIDDELQKEIMEHVRKRNKIANRIVDIYDEAKKGLTEEGIEQADDLDAYYTIFDKYGPLSYLEKSLKEEDEIIRQLKEKANVKEEPVVEKEEIRKEEVNTNEDLQQEIQKHIEARDRIAKEIQETYNKIKDYGKENNITSNEDVNNYYSLFGPEGPLARLENELNKENDIIKELKEKANIKEDPVVEIKESRKEEVSTDEELERQLKEHTENRKRIAQELLDTYNKIKEFRLNNPLYTKEDENEFNALFGPEGPLAKLEAELNKEDEMIAGLKQKLGERDVLETVMSPEQEMELIQEMDSEKEKNPEQEMEREKEVEKEPTLQIAGPTQPPLSLPSGEEKEVEEPKEEIEEQKARSLNTILASIIVDSETNEPVNLTRRQRKIYENGNIQVRKRFAKDLSNGNVIYNLVSIAPAIIRFPISLIQKLSGKILTTRKTKKNMKIVRENLEKLPVQDLEVLEREYKGNTIISERGMLGIDGLIQERLEKFRYEKIELDRAQMKALYDKVLNDYQVFRSTNDLLRSINEHRISDEELNRLIEENGAKSRNHLTRILKEQCDNCLHGKAEEIKQIRQLRIDIQEAYSGGLHGHEEDFRAKGTKMNEKGMRFAKDISTEEAYEFTKILGQLEDAERDAIENGNDLEALRLFIAQEKKKVTATEQRKSIFGWRETGLANYDPIPESLDYRQDPFVRNLLTTISIAGLTVGAIHEIQNRIAQANAQANTQAAAEYQNAVNQHNQVNSQASSHNMQQNQTIHDRGSEMAGRSDDINRGMQQQTGEAIAGRRAVDEYADNDLTGWTQNAQYRGLDNAHHAATQQAADHATQSLGDIQQRLATGQITDVQALREMQSLSDSATQEFVQACREAIPICKQYAANHPQFEYSGYIENLERFANDPSAINALNDAAVRSVEIGNELQGINILPYEQLAETLQYLPVEVQSQLFALGSAALLTGRAITRAEYLKKYGADYNDELKKRIEEIDQKDKERQEAKKKKETEEMLEKEEEKQETRSLNK